MDIYDAVKFKMRFRFSKETVTEILHLLTDDIKPSTYRNKSVNPMNQLLLTLRFYAAGSFQQLIGDSMNVHKSTISRVVSRVKHSKTKSSIFGLRIKKERRLSTIVACRMLHNTDSIAHQYNDVVPPHDVAIELQTMMFLLKT
ncbi:hypothetical protein RN001_005511 [Aquatica leii]|uniref:Transposase Helix-turn-helix domain-containing protein n=1 Tax=Aquatica leii TaxID=1421715 RepID=A0AAN7PC09_9COLE|nr:hypothetical protein RN001_005511 [Aquatica leii]